MMLTARTAEMARSEEVPSTSLAFVLLCAFVLALALDGIGLPMLLMPVVILGPLEIATHLPRLALATRVSIRRKANAFGMLLLAVACPVAVFAS